MTHQNLLPINQKALHQLLREASKERLPKPENGLDRLRPNVRLR